MQWDFFEEVAYKKGYEVIAGVDEAGRGSLAGPVVAAACILPRKIQVTGINDSKKLTAEQRNDIYHYLINHPKVVYGIGTIDHKTIDQVNILQASHQAMLIAIKALHVTPQYLLIDGNRAPQSEITLETIIRGDSKSHSIAAASIIAKVTRDRLMVDFHNQWPVYGFDSHKGYATEKHLHAIAMHGPCEIHRLTYAPFRPDLFKTERTH